MKFRCERDVLVDALGIAGRGVASRSGAQPVLSGIRLQVTSDQLQLTGTDLDLTIQIHVEVAGNGDGAAVAPGRLINDIVRALPPGAVTVEADDDELRIHAGRSQFSVRTHPVGEFPRVNVAGGQSMALPVDGLVDALRQVVRAASTEESRPLLTGVLLAAEDGDLRLVATDSYRLAVRDLPGAGVLAEGQKVLVPSRALGELQRLLAERRRGGDGAGEVTLQLGERDVTFTLGSVLLNSRLIEGEFPNYRKLIPTQNTNQLTIAKEPLLDALRRVKLLARDPTTPVRIVQRPDSIEVTVITTDWGQATEEVDAKYEGAEMTVAFNPTYLIDGVEAITSDEIVLSTLDALKPATIRPTDSDEYVYLLMPVRVS